MKLFMLLLFTVAFMVAQSQQNANTRLFGVGLDSIRAQLKIPGMSTAVMQGDSILFTSGFGYSDVEHGTPVTAQTSFRVASVTKTFTSTLLMQLVERGKLNLDAPIGDFGIDLGNPAITIRNLVTHTSEGIPGAAFQYNGFRYGRLGPVIEKAAGLPFYELLMKNIVMPLGMHSSAPGISLDQYYQYLHHDASIQPYFDTAFRNLARPYEVNSQGKVVLTEYQNEFGAFGGLITTAGDLLKYSRAIDQHQFVNATTQQQIYTPNKTSKGESTPYGLGWFVQTYNGLDFYWHYGQTQGESALFIKVPALQLTLAVLCNSDQLSRPFPLGDGDLFTSPVGQLFYTCFIAREGAPTEKYFINRELITAATMALLNKDSITAQKYYAEYAKLNFRGADSPAGGRVAAEIRNVGINKDLVKPFTLYRATKLRVYGVGENCSSDFTSWCDYGWIENVGGKVVWQMQGQPAKGAGGAKKNQRVEQVILLPPGKYRLRYKSDWGHGFGNWDSLPPNNFFWGIVVVEI